MLARKAVKDIVYVKAFHHHLPISGMNDVHDNKPTYSIELALGRKKTFEFVLAIQSPECLFCRIEDKNGLHLFAKLHDDIFIEVAFKFVALLGTDVAVHIAQAEHKALKHAGLVAVGKEVHLEIDFGTIQFTSKRDYILSGFFKILRNHFATGSFTKIITIFRANEIIANELKPLTEIALSTESGYMGNQELARMENIDIIFI